MNDNFNEENKVDEEVVENTNNEQNEVNTPNDQQSVQNDQFNSEFYNNQNSIYDQNPDQKKPNGLGIASLVLGIVSIVTCCCYGVSIIPAIVGLVLGIIQMRKYNNGIAIAGLVTSIFGILLNIYMIFSILVAIQSYGGLQGYLDEIQRQIDEQNNSISNFVALIKNLF